jgi:hypothetical protein
MPNALQQIQDHSSLAALVIETRKNLPSLIGHNGLFTLNSHLNRQVDQNQLHFTTEKPSEGADNKSSKETRFQVIRWSSKFKTELVGERSRERLWSAELTAASPWSSSLALLHPTWLITRSELSASQSLDSLTRYSQALGTASVSCVDNLRRWTLPFSMAATMVILSTANERQHVFIARQ